MRQFRASGIAGIPFNAFLAQNKRIMSLLIVVLGQLRYTLPEAVLVSIIVLLMHNMYPTHLHFVFLF
jgi:hypothetical protein